MTRNENREDAGDHHFGRDRRLTRRTEFDHVFAEARRSRDACFTVLYRSNGRDDARLGLAISRKNCRLAVERNRLKRIIRESFRTHRAALRGLDIVVMNRQGAETRANSRLFESLAAHWARCSAPSNRGQEKR